MYLLIEQNRNKNTQVYSIFRPGEGFWHYTPESYWASLEERKIQNNVSNKKSANSINYYETKIGIKNNSESTEKED